MTCNRAKPIGPYVHPASPQRVWTGRPYCRRCGRPLMSPQSRRAGIGAVCAVKERAQGRKGGLLFSQGRAS